MKRPRDEDGEEEKADKQDTVEGANEESREVNGNDPKKDEEEEDDDMDNFCAARYTSRVPVRKGAECPYLDTISRLNLDFDFEKCCSISLSPVNVYACLVCGKYFQVKATQPLPAALPLFPAASRVLFPLAFVRPTLMPLPHRLQGRSPKTHAYTHALESRHHMFMKLDDGKVRAQLPSPSLCQDLSCHALPLITTQSSPPSGVLPPRHV